MTLPPPGQPSRLDVEPLTLFVYGTLAFPEVLQVLLGRVPESTEAVVPGWRLAALPGRIYPAMVVAEAMAHGRLIADLSNAEWQIIDAFEDDIYELRQLRLTKGRTAWAYVCGNDLSVSADNWDAAQFEREHFVGYLKQCASWRRDLQARP